MMLALGLVAFLCFGVVLILVGANQADLGRDLHLDLSRTGLLGSALALGIGLGVVAAGPLVDRYPRRPIFVASVLLVACALLGVDARMGFARALLHVALLGLGAGVYDTLINTIIVERHRERSARPMAAVHAAVTIGAMLGPWLVAWLATRRDWTASFHWTGAAHLGLAAWALLLAFPRPRPPPAEPELGGPRAVLSPTLVPFACIGFAYVGVEAALTLFAVPYATSALGLAEGRGLAAISALWFGLLAGRLGLLGLRGAIDARLLVAAGAASTAALLLGVGLAPSRVELLFAGVGIALAPVFPVMLALAGQRFPQARGAALGLAAGAGALGGFAIPWLHGGIGDWLGARVAVGALALWSLAIFIAGLAARRLHPVR